MVIGGLSQRTVSGSFAKEENTLMSMSSATLAKLIITLIFWFVQRVTVHSALFRFLSPFWLRYGHLHTRSCCSPIPRAC